MEINFDPVALWLGPFPVHWYGLMYVLGFVFFLLLRSSYSLLTHFQEEWRSKLGTKKCYQNKREVEILGFVFARKT